MDEFYQSTFQPKALFPCKSLYLSVEPSPIPFRPALASAALLIDSRRHVAESKNRLGSTSKLQPFASAATPAGTGRERRLHQPVPHTFIGETEGAKALIGFQPFQFEGFLHEVGEPATERVLPPPLEAPPDMKRLLPIAARNGMEILGPPGPPSGL